MTSKLSITVFKSKKRGKQVLSINWPCPSPNPHGVEVTK